MKSRPSPLLQHALAQARRQEELTRRFPRTLALLGGDVGRLEAVLADLESRPLQLAPLGLYGPPPEPGAARPTPRPPRRLLGDVALYWARKELQTQLGQPQQLRRAALVEVLIYALETHEEASRAA